MTEPRIHRIFRQGPHWCVVADNGLAFWVGYVSIPTDHLWHGLHYDTIEELYEVSVHGGLTFSDERDWANWQGADDGCPPGWYVGFDCGHYCDLPLPGSHIAQYWLTSDSLVMHEWDVESVAREVRHLATVAELYGTVSQVS